MKITFKRNLLISFGVSMLLLIISSVASFTSIQSLSESARQVEHTNQVIHGVEEVISVLKDAETGQRGFLLTGREEFLEPFNGAYDVALQNLAEVRLLTVDNPAQQLSCKELHTIIVNRMQSLRDLIEKKRAHEDISEQALILGKKYMDQARSLIRTMSAREQKLLEDRTSKMNRFAAYTPTLILIAALLSVIITVVSFLRVNNDFDRRVKLQQELEQKDADITRRIHIIKDVADKIATGNYTIRTEGAGTDGLGNLSYSLNKMAASLEYSFNLLSDKEWLQTGVVSLNEIMLGEYDLSILCRTVVEKIADYTGSQAGAFYVVESGQSLRFVSGYAFVPGKDKEVIRSGDGLVGQCALDAKRKLLENITDELLITHATGVVKPANIVAVPIYHEKTILGVIELAAVHPYTQKELLFLDTVAGNIGTIINNVENRKRLQELLEETQAQAEELQAQHAELENMNSELEVQAEKLQASEEELKVQQEELMETNQELEEKARSLEEKNEMIFERNLEIQRKAEELALSTRYKSEFLANMSHELRTPLNSILLLSRLMSENNEHNLSADQIEYARVILSSGNGLLALIDEILDLSKIEAGKMELQYGEVYPAAVMQDLKNLFQPVAKERGVELRMTMGENVPAIIETDKLRLEQILKNLLSNAIKFTAQGYVQLLIDMQPGNPAAIRFSVTDTGIGIPAGKQHLIFEAFQQADGSTRRKYGGTGLGLSISRELAKLLGGEIKLTSEEDKGSEFVLIIPVSKDGVLAAADNQYPLFDGNSATDTATAPAPAERKRFLSEVIPAPVPDDRDVIESGDSVIMIVEDDTSFAKSVLDYTRRRGYKGIVAVKGDDALPLALQYRPAGILLDIQLPVKDGWEVMEELKSNARTRHIPVHIMSSYEVKYKSLSEGAIDFINKPMAFDQMQEVFRKIEYVLTNNPKKVLIVEENNRHAKALSYFLETFRVKAEIKSNVAESVSALKKNEVNCVILDMGVPDQQSYDTLEEVKKTPGLENIPIIIFTGKSLSRAEELRIKQYADSIVIKTAHSYQRIMDEVSLFLHLVEEKTDNNRQAKNLGALQEVLKNKVVLVADDDVRNIYSLTRSLEKFDMQVISAIDGKEALAQLEKNPNVNIVLMDMMMPEMDGYETTRHIKMHPKFKNVPVIAVTAKAMVGDREKCIQAGASDYITKPVDIDQLLSLLRVWLYDAAR